MVVDIPVKLVCEGCRSCPDIEIEKDTFDYEGWNTTTQSVNSYYCKNYRKCMMMNNYLLKEIKEKKES